jgi:hypothetical protein
MLQKINDKKGVSIMIGYILLISITVAMSVFVYSWVKTYVPKEISACPEGTFISIKELSCSNNPINNNSYLSLNLKNNGRFNIAGYFIHATNEKNQELATIDISPNIIQGGIIFGNSILFTELGNNSMEPNSENEARFILDYKIYSLEIVPIRFQKEGTKNVLVGCGKSKIKEVINCN